MRNTYYDLRLPVWKQGEDFQNYLNNGDRDKPAEAFLALAEHYEVAAGICRRVAGVVAEAPEGSVAADGVCPHSITILGPAHVFGGLVADGVLTLNAYNNDYNDEDDEDDDGVYEDGLDDT